VDLLTKAELDVGNGLLVVLELQRGKELKGETRVSSLGDVPEGSAYPYPTRETEELLLKSQSLECREVDNPGVAKLPLAQRGMVLSGALSGVSDSLIRAIRVRSATARGCVRRLIIRSRWALVPISRTRRRRRLSSISRLRGRLGVTPVGATR